MRGKAGDGLSSAQGGPHLDQAAVRQIEDGVLDLLAKLILQDAGEATPARPNLQHYAHLVFSGGQLSKKPIQNKTVTVEDWDYHIVVAALLDEGHSKTV